jgi:hypothetical protein
MESHFIKVAKKPIGKYPYFAKDKYNGTIWLVKYKVHRAYVNATMLSRTRYCAPFEDSLTLPQSQLEKIDRMRITFQIGDNVDY